MNKNIKILLATVLTASSSLLALGAGEFNRTALLIADVNTHVENCYSRLKMAEKADNAVGFTVGLMGYFQQALGTRSAEQLGNGLAPNSDPASLTALNSGTLLVGDTDANATDLKVNFKADHRRVGANLSGCYNLDSLYEGLYIGANAGIIYERTLVTPTITATLPGTATAAATNVTNYLKGDALPAAANAHYTHTALTTLKVSGAAKTVTGFNNVDLCAGLRVINTDNAQVCVRVVGTLPTGSKHKVEDLFQPNGGVRNGKLGVGACALVKLLSDESYALNFVGDAQWQYGVWKRKEAHVPTHKTIPFAHYRLVATTGTVVAFQPLANLLSGMTAEVDSKSEVNALAKLCFEKGILGVEVGGHFFYAQEKNLKLSALPTGSYYFLSAVGSDAYYNATGAVAFTGNNVQSATAIAVGDFLTTYPSQVQGKVFAGVNALFTEWDFPMMLGGTVSYTFASKRTVTPEVWGLSLKAGVSF